MTVGGGEGILGSMTTSPPLYSDAPVYAVGLDALGRAPVARRLVDMVTVRREQPLVIGVCGGAGSGKTSVLRMAGELLAQRTDLRAFAMDAWILGSAKKLTELFVDEVSQIFEDEGVVKTTDKLRDRLVGIGDMVSTVARFAGVSVDVKGALALSADALEEELLTLTQAVGKRIVVVIDHLDRLPPAESIAVLKVVHRFGRFSYFAFVLGLDRTQLSRDTSRADGDDDIVGRVVSVELPLPPCERMRLAGWIRGALSDLAEALELDPGGALELFDVETGLGLDLVTNLRQAKRLCNTLAAVVPLAGDQADLRRAVLLELVREQMPDAYPLLFEHLAVEPGASPSAELAADLETIIANHRRPTAAQSLMSALIGR